jgi:hypothetical protein
MCGTPRGPAFTQFQLDLNQKAFGAKDAQEPPSHPIAVAGRSLGDLRL